MQYRHGDSRGDCCRDRGWVHGGVHRQPSGCTLFASSNYFPAHWFIFPIPPSGSSADASRTPLDSRHVRPRRRLNHPPLPTAGDRVRRHHEPSLATAAWHYRRGRRAHLRGCSWWLCLRGRQHQPRLCQPVGQARPDPHLVPGGHGRGRPRWPARRRCHLARRAVPRRRHRKRAR